MTLFFALLAALAIYVAYIGGLDRIARHRLYKSGTGWCYWRWTDTESEYILRLHIVKTPFGAICLHWIKKADAEPWLHDHPVSFLSVILRGSYAEMRKTGDGPLRYKVNSRFNFVRASKADRHRIVLTRTNTLTLCFMGPKTREWGFHVWTELDPSGWIYWKDYYERLREGEDMRQRKTILPMIETAADVAGNRHDAREAAFYSGAWHDEERTIDLRPADAFDPDEVTGEFQR